MVGTVNGQVNLLISQNKWNKAKAIIRRIINELEVRTVLNHKQLERDRGFLIYLSRTYRSRIPYLKEAHLSLDSWREGRNADDWKKSIQELLLMMYDEIKEYAILENEDAPKYVVPVPRLLSDLMALEFSIGRT